MGLKKHEAGRELADIAGTDYWDEMWTRVPPSDASIDAVRAIEAQWPESEVARRIRSLISAGAGATLLEIGCANSAWLPYFAARGFDCVGLDYSIPGCERARDRIRRSGVTAEVVCSDATKPPTNMVARFDVVVSFGVVEHFEETSEVVSVFSQYLRPGGFLVTEVPNMRGMVGFLQRAVSKRVFQLHVPIAAHELARVHDELGLLDVTSEYVVLWNMGVVNAERLRHPAVRWMWNGTVTVTNWLGRRLDAMGLKANRWTSPYVLCVARRPSCE
jgi:2-polyprenyl-3-methyl-5-hydroxy-6-metoxy-1,4-benzoquinol methylase